MEISSRGKEKNIVYICDDHYVIPTIVSIRSITENTTSSDIYRYVIYICTWNVSDEDCRRISALETEKVHIFIKPVDIQRFRERLDLIQQGTYVTPAALMKFEIPRILPEIDEVLYLDSDVIINRSLHPLFEYDITDYALAAVFDIVFYKAVTSPEEQEKKRPDFYFNAGVMLLNLKTFREENLSDLLWKTKLSSAYDPSEKLKLMDQNTLNEVLATRCLPLPIRYNCPVQRISNASANMTSVNQLYGTNYTKPAELLKDAVAIHYIGRKTKPWLYEPCRCQAIWDHYCIKAGIRLEDLHRNNTDKNAPVRKSLRNDMARLRNSVKSGGLRKTIAYVSYNRKLRKCSKR